MDGRGELEDLILLAIYSSGWYEDLPNVPGGREFRAWRGYRLEVLNTLERKNLILQSSGSVTLTDRGVLKGKRLKDEFQQFRKNRGSKPKKKSLKT